MASPFDFLNLTKIEGLLSSLTQTLGSIASTGIVVSPVNSAAFTATQVAAGVAATLLIAANTSRKYLAIRNIGANPVFIGGSGVTIATGYSLAAGATLEMKESVTTAAVYGVVAAATETLSVLEW